MNKHKNNSNSDNGIASLTTTEHSTAQTVKKHWRSQVDALLEQSRQAEEAVASAREVLKSLAAQHEAQWQATQERQVPLLNRHVIYPLSPLERPR